MFLSCLDDSHHHFPLEFWKWEQSVSTGRSKGILRAYVSCPHLSLIVREF